MKTLPIWGYFARYTSIGVLNTLIHWCVFFTAYFWLGLNQAYSNLLGFMVAASFSFFGNARYTFKSGVSWVRYFLFVLFMGALSLAVGFVSDTLKLPALVTLIVFSGLSLIVGFFYSRHVVFREPAP
jgi:putative flippase GtrA